MPPILNANVWQKLENHFEFQHHKIFYIDLGCQDAPTVLLLHGFPTLAFDFDRLVPKLVLDFRLILPDFLDFSFSDKPSAQHYSIFEHAEMIEKLIASCKLQAAKMFLLTHDRGNSVGLELLRRRKLSIQRYLMLNGGMLLKYYQLVLSQMSG